MKSNIVGFQDTKPVLFISFLDSVVFFFVDTKTIKDIKYCE